MVSQYVWSFSPAKTAILQEPFGFRRLHGTTQEMVQPTDLEMADSASFRQLFIKGITNCPIQSNVSPVGGFNL